LPPEDDERVIEKFSLWALPENQERIREWCEGIDAVPIRWLVDAQTD